MRLLKEHEDTKLFVVGEYGRQFFSQHHIPIERSFLYTAQNPTMYRAREICAILLDLFDSGKLDKIYIIYTDLKKWAQFRGDLHQVAAFPPKAIYYCVRRGARHKCAI